MDADDLYALLGSVWLKRNEYLMAESLLASPSARAPNVSDRYTDLVKEVVTIRTEFERALQGEDMSQCGGALSERVKRLESSNEQLMAEMVTLKDTVSRLTKHLEMLSCAQKSATEGTKKQDVAAEDIDLFGSDDEPEDAEKEKIRQQRLQAYEAKKAKKPAAVAKSSVVLDVKPWDDETDMKDLESRVRSIAMDGLVWGASKLVPVGYGIKKLQIMCVVEDEKVSVEYLSEQIEAFEDHVQSVDIAAFNKI